MRLCIPEYIAGSSLYLDYWDRDGYIMNTKHWHSPVLLLVDRDLNFEFESVRKWLAGREVVYYEAADVFDAADELCDFTVETSPDLILIPVSASEHCDAEFARNMLGAIGSTSEPYVVVYSKRSRSNGAVHDLDALGDSLSKCFAYPAVAGRRSASV